MEYPICIFGNLIGFGLSETFDNSLPAFWFSDFPIPRKTKLWGKFPEQLLFQPKRIERFRNSPSKFNYPKLLHQSSTPNYIDWVNLINSFKKTNLEKTILARKSSFTFASKISPLDLFRFLKQRNKHSFHFAIIFDENLAFIGATPEKLFSRRGKKIEFEALAGTLPSSEESKLLRDKKLIKEFQIVKETLTEQLQKICKPFRINQKIFIKKAGNVSHLHYPFCLELLEPISDEELIHFLHPTPAIGGRPRNDALKFIEHNEAFDRGLYAGTLGILSKQKSDVYVSIRSALISENELHVFTGAGIVQESDPFLEWNELDQKQRLFNL